MGARRQRKRRDQRRAKRAALLARWDHLKRWKPGETAIWIPGYSPDETLVEIVSLLKDAGSYQIYAAKFLSYGYKVAVNGYDVTVGGGSLFPMAPDFGRERKPRLRVHHYLLVEGSRV